jgi:hypothetical protein
MSYELKYYDAIKDGNRIKDDLDRKIAELRKRVSELETNATAHDLAIANAAAKKALTEAAQEMLGTWQGDLLLARAESYGGQKDEVKRG